MNHSKLANLAGVAAALTLTLGAGDLPIDRGLTPARHEAPGGKSDILIVNAETPREAPLPKDDAPTMNSTDRR